MTIQKYCVMQIENGDIDYVGPSLHKAAVAWNPGTVLGQGKETAVAVYDALEQRARHRGDAAVLLPTS